MATKDVDVGVDVGGPEGLRCRPPQQTSGSIASQMAFPTNKRAAACAQCVRGPVAARQGTRGTSGTHIQGENTTENRKWRSDCSLAVTERARDSCFSLCIIYTPPKLGVPPFKPLALPVPPPFSRSCVWRLTPARILMEPGRRLYIRQGEPGKAALRRPSRDQG